jgi:hypothetical protein
MPLCTIEHTIADLLAPNSHTLIQVNKFMERHVYRTDRLWTSSGSYQQYMHQMRVLFVFENYVHWSGS